MIKDYDISNPDYAVSKPWSYTGVLKCPSWNYDLNAIYSPDLYAVCYGAGYAWTNAMGISDTNTSNPRRKIERLCKFSETVLIGDSLMAVDKSISYSLYCGNITVGESSAYAPFGVNPPHRQGYNNLWGDMHADWKTRMQLLQGMSGGVRDGVGIPSYNYYYCPKTQ